MIKLHYTSIDHVRETRKFRTIEGARKFAVKRVGEQHPDDVGCGYAVSSDGIGRIEVAFGTTLRELFARPVTATPDLPRCTCSTDTLYWSGCCCQDEQAHYEAADAAFRPVRSAGCTCDDAQLVHVGCDCRASDNETPPRVQVVHDDLDMPF